jgi:hypothetical protein
MGARQVPGHAHGRAGIGSIKFCSYPPLSVGSVRPDPLLPNQALWVLPILAVWPSTTFSPLPRFMDDLKITYFDIQGGRAEAARLALHVGCIAFEDRRFAFSEFAEVRKSTPLSQVPTLHINDLQVTQSGAITFAALTWQTALAQ